MISDQWDVVRVPFPFTDRTAAKKRPAVVIRQRGFDNAAGHMIMAMITKRENSTWPEDYDIQDWAEAGLKFPSWIRMKLFTIGNSLVIDTLGRLRAQDIEKFKAVTTQVFWDHPVGS